MNTKIATTLGILTLAAALGGCASDGQGRIYGNLTPELQTLNERPIDVHRNVAYANNHNSRMFWSDLGRFFITDHPSRLTNTPVVSATGNAR